MSSARIYYPQRNEINAGHQVKAITFSANGKYLLSGSDKDVRVWRIKDGLRVATMPVDSFWRHLAVSKDGRYIAAELTSGVLIWDATTYEEVWTCKPGGTVWGFDFSPDSTHLISANGLNIGTATIWDIATRQELKILHHGPGSVREVKYSPQGDRIATASKDSIRVWDSKSSQLLVDVKLKVQPWLGLLWFNDHLFVKASDSKIKQINASTGSTVSEWSPPGTDIALPQHGKFIASSTKDSITFWDTSAHSPFGHIPQTRDIHSITFSPDDHLFATVAGSKIIINDLSITTDSEIQIESNTLDAWKHGQLANADSLLTAAIQTPQNMAHHVLASRALVRARLRLWDSALVDAEESIEIKPSIIGYIAKCVALAGKGNIDAGCRVCDIAFYHFGPNYVPLLLLIKAVVLSMNGEHSDAISRIDDLVRVVHFNSPLYAVQVYMYLLFGNLHMESGDYERAIQSFEDARAKLVNCTHSPPSIVSLISGWNFDDLAVTVQRQSCEALFSAGRTKEAGESVLRMVDDGVIITEAVKAWIPDFIERCLSTPENEHDNDAPVIQDMIHPSHPMTQLLRWWIRLKLTTESWKDIFGATTHFTHPRSAIYQAICEHLHITGHVTDAVACFHQMSQETDSQEVLMNWTRDFASQCCSELVVLGDSAMDAKEYDVAISQFSTALSLNPATPQEVLVKRCKAHAGKGMWEDTLNDANKVVNLDSSSPSGYERKHVALHGIGRYHDATNAFETMLLKMSQSSDPEIRKQSCRYVTPQQTKEAIHTIIQDTIRDSPLVLINTASGRLCKKSEQATAFESEPAFMKLISSMTTCINHAAIKEEVGKFYRYATFSHTWEENEPLYETVIKIIVYDLAASPTYEKLQMFCKIAREEGFNWAWSDTCCINKADHFVLQEALVSMFKWYEGSAMTFIFLLGVDRMAKRGALTRCIWNMRAWTLQEYHASKVVRFYTQDWTPYLGLDLYNHKDSPEIVSEMEEATHISAHALRALCPGLDDIREKLRLASTRKTTRTEDAAYSLLGIFSMSLPILYGDGDKALGQLLAQLLASSGDMTILAWTGRSNSFNSCLPTSISVFSQLPSTHIPSAGPDAEIGTTTSSLRTPNLTAVTNLFDELNGLPAPLLSGRRMKLPCLTFKLGPVSFTQNKSGFVFRAQANVLGTVEISTEEDLSQLGSLYLIHPWVNFLLDRQPVGNPSITKILPEKNIDDDQSFALGELPSLPDPSHIVPTPQRTRSGWLITRLGRSLSGRPTTSVSDVASLLPPSTMSPAEKRKLVLQFIARLRQPFGALLLTSLRRNAEEYRRVAAESLIRVQVGELTPANLDKLIQGVRMLDVL